jgi:hypothetical protein
LTNSLNDFNFKIAELLLSFDSYTSIAAHKQFNNDQDAKIKLELDHFIGFA